MLLGCAPAALLGAFLANRELRLTEKAARRRLERAAALTALAVEQYLYRHLDAVTALAASLPPSDITTETLTRSLRATRASYPGFLTMVATDARGLVIAASPDTTFTGETYPLRRADVSDRSYFVEPMRLGRPFISQAFVGRTFGTDPIVAVSAPLAGTTGRRVGVVEGSLDLRRLAALDEPAEDEALLISDSGGSVVYASSSLGLRPLERSPGARLPEMLTGTATLRGGWQVVLAQPRSTVSRSARRAMVFTVSASLFALAFAVLLAHALSGWLTEPIEQLARTVRSLPGSTTGPPSVGRMPAEVAQLLSDFADLERRLRAAEQTAGEDALTGLANRRRFDEFLAGWWRVSARKGQPLSLLLVDVDDFKRYNDLHGHPEGDAVVRQVADVLRKMVRRTSDLAARIGGDEFALVFWDSGAEQAKRMAERIRAAVADLNIPHPGSAAGHLTVSVGVATTHPTVDEASEHASLVARADRALYAAKAAGRNRMEVAP